MRIRYLALVLGWTTAISGCQSGKPAEPIILAHIETSIDQARGLEIALAQLQAKTEKLPLGRAVKIVHAEAKNQPTEIEAQAIRLSQLNHPLAIFGGSGQESALALGKGISSDATLGFSLASPNRLAMQPNLFFLGLSRKQELELTLAWLIERKQPLRIGLIGNSEGDSAWNEEVKQAIGSHKELKIVDRNCDGIIAIDSTPEEMNKGIKKLTESASTDPKRGDDKNFKPALGSIPLFILGQSINNQLYWATRIQSANRADLKLHGIILSETLPALTEFEAQYREKYAETPTEEARKSFIWMQLVIEAIRRAGSLAPSRIREELQHGKTPFETLYGPVQFDAENGLRYRNAKIVHSP